MQRISPVVVQTAHVVDVKVNAAPRVDRVTQDSTDSFPASDPPSWTPLRIGAPRRDSLTPPAGTEPGQT
jgi:hypothetical protein